MTHITLLRAANINKTFFKVALLPGNKSIVTRTTTAMPIIVESYSVWKGLTCVSILTNVIYYISSDDEDISTSECHKVSNDDYF